MFTTVQEAEDDKDRGEDGSSTNDGYLKDKKTCFMCNEWFPSCKELTQHQTMCKDKQQCPKCPIVGASFNLVKNFRCHTEVCHEEGSFKCPHCSKLFLKYNKVGDHKYHYPSKRICHVCKFIGRSPEAMDKHIAKYHQTFTCKECNYKCLDRGMLTYHFQSIHNKKS